jgi:hypothetical protein
VLAGKYGKICAKAPAIREKYVIDQILGLKGAGTHDGNFCGLGGKRISQDGNLTGNRQSRRI